MPRQRTTEHYQRRYNNLKKNRNGKDQESIQSNTISWRKKQYGKVTKSQENTKDKTAKRPALS